MTAAPSAAVGRRSAARRSQPEPTPVRSALRGGGLLVLTGLLLLLVVLSTWIGTKDTTLGQVWTALWNDDGSYATDVIRQLRLPRTLVGLMTGAALGTAGAVMQAVTRNPRWASPPPCWAGCTSPGCCSNGAAPGPRDGGAPGLRVVREPPGTSPRRRISANKSAGAHLSCGIR
ncbi:iron chelate uptake ABC transporter family permease subunit [Streptomyces sp. CS147]|uniref:iron chelate uptake ABC transporter family permease subunit n=1 Tax=Streptomyces sp. CS147 TaxID=2162715 RepID=UPI0023B78B1A|nr:iron chelate uptake ABC transporter family permease subunit [Streptomyces sp. CS147]